MHPALSVIFFTTISGAGYGLAFLLALGLGDPSATSTKLAWFVALAMIALGLAFSTLHLGNPQRAWRAFSQWRSSWLSREGCMAIITFVPLVALAAMSLFGDSYSLILGLIAAACCAFTVYCTAMIYASLRTVATWHTPLTAACYLAFSLSLGLLIYLGFFTGTSGGNSGLTLAAIIALFCAWAVKYFWARRAGDIGYGESTMESATGLGHIGKVKLLERPHSMGNYLTNEMGFRIARKHNEMLWKITVLIGLFLPAVLLAFALALPGASVVFAALAAQCHLAGVFVERWLFFANAKHAVGLYYGGEDGLAPAE
ncbi:dimethyl sulfoxide reductase anchor subunit family protein [Pseudahrensia aquimaris]|uniref:Dimethyl sulfoxide reductase anchor subunit family protein n=1 Tax=Pseudahrensia aquimaris TaxID=744461 RepID=A0ABW3FNQ2_9HYPH